MKKHFCLVRFSYLLQDDNADGVLAGMGLEDRASYLFNPKRMDKRFRMFEKMCLPSLQQNNSNFSSIILTSTRLPETYRRRLLDLTANRKDIEVLFSDPGDYIALFSDAVRERVCGDDPFMTTCLDDDDALANDFGEVMATYVNDEYVGTAVSPACGYFVQDSLWGARAQYTERAYMSAGISLVSKSSDFHTVFDYQTLKRIYRFVPVQLENSRTLFMVSAHDASGTRSGTRKGRLFPVGTKSLRSVLKSESGRFSHISPLF